VKLVGTDNAVIQGGHKPGKPRLLSDFSEHGKPMDFSQGILYILREN